MGHGPGEESSDLLSGFQGSPPSRAGSQASVAGMCIDQQGTAAKIQTQKGHVQKDENRDR